MKSQIDKHVFAFFWNNSVKLNHAQESATIVLDDPDLYHRIHDIVRLESHDLCILFNREYAITVELCAVTKKSLTVLIKEKTTVRQSYMPPITVVLPLLKRDALEYAIDATTQCGATIIQLITTEKTTRTWSGSKEFDRLQRIIWAAAEQSKNFSFPSLLPPIPLNTFVESIKSEKQCVLFFDPQGISISDVVTLYTKNNYTTLMLINGPEGDLTQQEKQLLKNHDVIFTKLTPTILRAENAAALAVGIFRSLLD